MPADLEKSVESAMTEVRGLMKQLQGMQRKYQALCSNNRKLQEYQEQLTRGGTIIAAAARSPSPEYCPLNPAEVLELKKKSRGTHLGSCSDRPSPTSLPDPALDHSPQHTTQLEALVSEFAGEVAHDMAEGGANSLSGHFLGNRQGSNPHQSPAVTSHLRRGHHGLADEDPYSMGHRPVSAHREPVHYHSPALPHKVQRNGGLRSGTTAPDWLDSIAPSFHGPTGRRAMPAGAKPGESLRPNLGLLGSGAEALKIEGSSHAHHAPGVERAESACLEIWQGRNNAPVLNHESHHPYGQPIPGGSSNALNAYYSGHECKDLDLGGEEIDRLVALNGIDHHCPEDMLLEEDDGMELLHNDHYDQGLLFGSRTNMDSMWGGYIGLGDDLLYDSIDGQFEI